MTDPLPATETGAISIRGLRRSIASHPFLKGKRIPRTRPRPLHPPRNAAIRPRSSRQSPVPMILDADGLNAFAGRAQELKNPAGSARDHSASGRNGAPSRLDSERGAIEQHWNSRSNPPPIGTLIVILKGHQTVIASPDGKAWRQLHRQSRHGHRRHRRRAHRHARRSHRAIRRRFLAASSAFGVYLHGLAGDIASAESGEAPLMASDLIRALPRAYRQFFAETESCLAANSSRILPKKPSRWGRDIGAALEAACFGVALRRSWGGEDYAHERHRQRPGRRAKKTKLPVPPLRWSTNTNATRASIMWTCTASATSAISKRSASRMCSRRKR